MINMTRLFILFFVVLISCLGTSSVALAAGETATVAVATPPTGQFTSFITSISCKDYVKSLEEGKEKSQAALILGSFITGVNFSKGRETTLSLRSMTMITDKYCRENSDKPLVAALVALDKVLSDINEAQVKTKPVSLNVNKVAQEVGKSIPASAVTTKEPTLPPTKKEGEYVVQVISTQDKAEAAAVFERLKVKKLPVYQEDVDFGSKGVWLRIIIGPYSDKPSANKVAKELKKEKFACIVRPR